MRVFFDKELIGSSKSFVWDEGQVSLTDKADWYFDSSADRHMHVRPASEASGCDLIVTPRKPHVHFWKKHTQHPAWHRILSKTDMTMHIQHQVDKVVGFLKADANGYYLNQYQRQQQLLDALCPIRAVRDDEQHGVKLGCDGFAQVPHYDNVSSATGRMTVTEGPRILTMPKEARNIFVSRWGTEGTLLEVDYNALELRVLAWIQGFNVDNEDAYMWVARQIDAADTPRHIIKESILAAMYGMSRKNFALRYQDMPDAVDVYDKVRTMLGVLDLDRSLGKGDFANAFGRRLADTTARISHYVQSTAVDVACDGFMHLVETQPEIVPCFIIHDALVVDVHNDVLEDVKLACKDGLQVGIIGQHLQVRLRSFGSE